MDLGENVQTDVGAGVTVRSKQLILEFGGGYHPLDAFLTYPTESTVTRIAQNPGRGFSAITHAEIEYAPRAGYARGPGRAGRHAGCLM
jgi:hypothetical protein